MGRAATKPGPQAEVTDPPTPNVPERSGEAELGEYVHCRSRDELGRYCRDRQRVLGRRWWVSQDPELAAEQVAEYLGGARRARTWARELLEALERRAA